MKKIPPHIFWPGMVITILGMSFISGMILVYSSQIDGGARAISHSYDSSESESHDSVKKTLKKQLKKEKLKKEKLKKEKLKKEQLKIKKDQRLNVDPK